MFVSRSATICEIDTFMTLLSSTITNCADARMAMGSHLRIGEVSPFARTRPGAHPTPGTATVSHDALTVPGRRRGQLPRPASAGALVGALPDSARHGLADHAAPQSTAHVDHLLRRRPRRELCGGRGADRSIQSRAFAGCVGQRGWPRDRYRGRAVGARNLLGAG